MTRTFIAAHEAAVAALHEGSGAPKAGICLQMPLCEAARPGDAGCETLRATLQEEMIDVYLRGLQGDFVGVQYYTRERLDPAVPGHNAPPPEGAELTLMGWEIEPEGLHRAITTAASGSGLPVIVTENGIATADDAQRVALPALAPRAGRAGARRGRRRARLHVLVLVRQLRVERGLPADLRDDRDRARRRPQARGAPERRALRRDRPHRLAGRLEGGRA